MTMWSSWFTRQMYSTRVGLVMPAFGVAEFIGGFTVGRFIDSFGRSPGLALGATFGLGAMVLVYSGNKNMVSWCKTNNAGAAPCEDYDEYGSFYVAAVLFGFMDCLFQSVCGGICAKSFASTGNSADAFALFRTFQAAGAAVCFFISSGLSIDKGSTSTEKQLLTELVITATMGYLAIMGHWLFSKFEGRAKAIAADDASPFFASADSQGVVANGFLHTAGCIGLPPGETASKQGLGTSMEDQTRQACNNLKAILNEACCSIADVVKTTVYISDGADEDTMNHVYAEFFVKGRKFPPARSVVIVAGIPHNAKFKIEAIASIP